DIQGSSLANLRDGNWITGINFIDNLRLGNQDKMPDSLTHNKANNKLYALPFILGLIGLLYHFKQKGADALVNMLLFFFTGLAIVVYLNQAGNQPRERDYAYVGSFYAFAVWIGLGVLQVKSWITRVVNQKVAATLATVICLLAVPVLMAQQEWDDHDRSNKTLARDLAKDYLESCPKDAILFCFGDNDTYPLWYAQEVEGIRKDIRVINFSLLGIDWYINQLRYKVNESAPIDVIWSADQIEGRKRDYVPFKPNPKFPESAYYDLYDVMKNYIGSDNPAFIDNSRGEPLNTFPVKKFAIPVNKDEIIKNGIVNATDSILAELRFDLNKDRLLKNDLAVLNIIAANKWKRPICFTSNNPYQIGLGFERFLRMDGLTYRLVPVDNSNGTFNTNAPLVNTDWAYDKMMNNFAAGNANVKGVYFDEENRRHLNSIREAYTELAFDLISKNRMNDAKKVLQHCDSLMLQENVPYGMVSRANQHNRNSLRFLTACYEVGDKDLAAKVLKSLKTDIEQQQVYYASLGDGKTSVEAYKKLMDDYITRYNSARTRQDQVTADNILQSNLSQRQINSLNDIRMSYMLLVELNNVEITNNKTQQVPAQTSVDTTKK
ncbi:MAG TPA: DUF2723 domain-containing protein, partial [Chitinophagaceae bacterium]|nr:DUF2723 domain-containing protein [Chitinophagaceae bacterium]